MIASTAGATQEYFMISSSLMMLQSRARRNRMLRARLLGHTAAAAGRSLVPAAGSSPLAAVHVRWPRYCSKPAWRQWQSELEESRHLRVVAAADVVPATFF